MKYTIARLCGGEAILLIPRDIQLDLDLNTIAEELIRQGIRAHFDGVMVIMQWGEMDITLYESGKIMFYPLKDRATAITYAGEIMKMIR